MNKSAGLRWIDLVFSSYLFSMRPAIMGSPVSDAMIILKYLFFMSTNDPKEKFSLIINFVERKR